MATRGDGKQSPSTGVGHGLTARLLLITIALLLVGELLIWLPSIARFRLEHLNDQLDKAHLSTLVLQAAGDGNIPPELEQELLAFTDTEAIILRTGGARTLVIGKTPKDIDRTVHINESFWPVLIMDAVGTLLHGEQRRIRIVGWARNNDSMLVEVVARERVLARKLRSHSIRILELSLALSVFLGTFLFLLLQWIVVRPVQKITHCLDVFARNPEDKSAILPISGRKDEVGFLESGLMTMQDEIRVALRKRGREAALGASVSKVNHDLRNVLTVAIFTSDQLAESKDPLVKKVMPQLIAAMNRATLLCARTLDYLRYGDSPVLISRVRLHELANEVSELVMPLVMGSVEWRNEIPQELTCEADHEQFFRAFLNLIDNAATAIGKDGTITVSARRTAVSVIIEVADTGPGLDEATRASLDAPPSDGPDPSRGLGFAIVREIMVAHGGSFQLGETSPEGTRFVLVLPLR